MKYKFLLPHGCCFRNVINIKVDYRQNSKEEETTSHYLDLPLRLLWYCGSLLVEARSPSCSQVRQSQQGGGSVSPRSTQGP